MIYGSYGYANSISSLYKYSYNSMRSPFSTANAAGVGSVSPVSKNSYVNSDAIKALTDIRNNASALRDSLDVMTQVSTFKKMYTGFSENVAANSGRSPNPAHEDTQADVKQAVTENVNEGTETGANRIAAANINEDKQTNASRIAAADVNEDTKAEVRQRQSANVENDTKPATDAVKNLVDSFNKLADSAKGNSRLTGDLNGTYASYASNLEEMGITSKSDGTLAVGYDKLDKAASNGSLESFFTKTDGNGGFTGKLLQIANNAAKGGYGVAEASGANQRQSPQSAQNLDNAYKYSRNNHSYVYNYLFGTSGGSTLGALFNLYA